jgi:hypothetical protein
MSPLDCFGSKNRRHPNPGTPCWEIELCYGTFDAPRSQTGYKKNLRNLQSDSVAKS